MRVVIERDGDVGARGAVTAQDLTGLRFFEGMPSWALERLASSARRVRLEAGDVVVRQNDEARAAFFLLSGKAQVLVYFEGAGDLLMGVQRDPGSLLAFSAFRAPYRHTSSVRCEEPSELLRVPRGAFEELFEEDVRLAGALAFLEAPEEL
jgi:CRP-like cAMP-binding protein